ncbi:MAG: DUF1376 domain-containing protein [Burkholderiaceae bacterium]|nr:DUF1376 domain-containing protein [Burkholderiaceae bacterium]
MHFYQFHIGDYKSHTHHLSMFEDLAFRRLLDHYYLHEAPIKQRDIARQIGMRDNEQEVLAVLNEFFISTEDGFINPRADTEIAKYRKFSEDGKKGAAMRWHKDTNGEANSPPNATPMATNNHKPITNNQIKPSICPPNGELEPAPIKKLPECNHKAVIELYHENLPTMRRVEVWNETRAGYLRQRWREVAAELAQEKAIEVGDVLNWWAEFFQSVGKSRFLTGRVNSKDGRAFVADLEWILKPSNFAKIVEGKYHGNN